MKMSFGFTHLFLLLISFALIPETHYSCFSYFGYVIPWLSTDCFYNPDVDDHIVNIIHKYTGVIEIHKVITEDKYHLTLFRIPRKNPKGIILFQHPMFYDSKIWTSQFNESIAFIFWNAGYDIWLGNNRGSEFSTGHDILQQSERFYWDFSFHELGYYDNYAVIKYIKEKTKKKIIYMGYSLGATTGLVYGSSRPDEAANAVKLMVLIGPVAYINYGDSLSKYLVSTLLYLYKQISSVIDVGTTVFNKHSLFTKNLKKFFFYFPCKKCLNYGLAALSGWSDGFNPKYISSIISTFGHELPKKLYLHFYQLYLNGKFAMYDYGEDENIKRYGTKQPTKYPLDRIEIPVVIVHGNMDSFVSLEDIENLKRELPKRSQVYGNLKADGQNHIDFCFSPNRFKIFDKILHLLDTLK